MKACNQQGFWKLHISLWWWRPAGAPLPAETRNCGAHIIKLKSPGRKSSLATQSGKLALGSCEPNDLVPCEQIRSCRVLEPWECKVGKWRWATERWFPDIRNRGKEVFEGHLQIRQTVWGHKINHSRDSSVLLMNPPLFGRPRFKGSDVSNEKLLLLRALLHLVWHTSWHRVLCNVNGMHSSKTPTWIGSACHTWLAACIYYVT